MNKSVKHHRRHRTGVIARLLPSGGWVDQLQIVLREWRVELTALLLIALGVFLLVEQYQIRATAWRFLKKVATVVIVFARRVIEDVSQISLSDLTGLVLIFIAVGLLAWRVHYRLRTSPRWTRLECPLCGGSLRRTRRRPIDFIINQLIHVRRYQCRNSACDWVGLRVKSKR